MQVLECKNQLETQQLAVKLSALIKRPCLVLLTGKMGAGKTQFVSWMLKELGVVGVSSPTFAILQQYPTPSGPVEHVDLYRVESDEDLESTGFWDLLRTPDLLGFIEWSDRLPLESWPAGLTLFTIHLEKDPRGEEFRQVQLTGFEPDLI